MILQPSKIKRHDGEVVDGQEIVCTVCTGTSFHVVVVNKQNFLQCANPACGEFYSFRMLADALPKD
jgi:hypothetical protein